MKAEEILEIIQANMTEYEFACQEFNTHELGLGEYEVVDSGGGEGRGSHWFRVFHFLDHGVYIKIIGDYQSYSGIEFYDGYGREVKPFEKTITVYE